MPLVPKILKVVVVVAITLPSMAIDQCALLGEKAQSWTFRSVQELKDVGGPAGMELYVEETGRELVGKLLDYEGTSSPIETKLKGALNGCDVNLSGRNQRGAVEVRGTIGVVTFKGMIIRGIGKDKHKEPVKLRRRLPDGDDHVGAL